MCIHDIEMGIFCYKKSFTHLSFVIKCQKTQDVPTGSDMPCLSTADCYRSLRLIEAGLSCHKVSRRFGCAHTAVTRLVERHQVTGSVNDWPRSGEPRVTTPNQDRHIRLQNLRDRLRTADWNGLRSAVFVPSTVGAEVVS